MAKNKPLRESGAFYSYRGKVHNTHVPQNLASSGYPEYNLPEGTLEESKERMWRNAERK